MSELLFIALLLNAFSVAATHCVVGESYTHWSHRPWRDGHPTWNYFHLFSALRWPLLILVVYRMPYYYWIVVPVALQAVWWITKKAFKKDWKSFKTLGA